MTFNMVDSEDLQIKFCKFPDFPGFQEPIETLCFSIQERTVNTDVTLT